MHLLTFLAAEDSKSGAGAAGLFNILILLLIPLAMYFLLIRPQRRRARAQQDMQSQLDVGDEIITNSGMYGFITGFDDDRVWVEIDDDVQVRLARAAIQGKVDTSGGPASSPPLTRTEREAERNTEATEQAADDTADSE